ncbi:MAG TPA: hypothetical protein VF613_17470 [Longimicrobium sp.]|jgi:hypothetical protein
MPFDLKISFSGLCLFVPDALRKQMHVLLPSAHSHAHGAEPHIPLLRFDTAHLRRSSPESDNMLAHKRFQGFTLQLGTGGADVKMLSSIPNIRSVSDKPVDPVHLGAGTTKLASRLTLAGGSFTGLAKGDCWYWADSFHHLTHRVEWTIPAIEDTSLTLVPLDFAGAPHSDLEHRHVTLYPMVTDSVPVINLAVDHLPTGEIFPLPGPPSRPEPGATPQHFGAYFELFEKPIQARFPKYAGDSGCPPAESAGMFTLERGATPFNCMVAGGGP